MLGLNDNDKPSLFNLADKNWIEKQKSRLFELSRRNSDTYCGRPKYERCRVIVLDNRHMPSNATTVSDMEMMHDN